MGLLDTLQRKGTSATGQFDIQIAETERLLKEEYAAVGEIFLKQSGDNLEREYVPHVNEVKKLLEQKKTLERNKLAAQGLRLCESCHQVIPLDSVFCNKCGAKMEPFVVSTAGGRFCPSCGAPIEKDNTFCSECGAKLG